MQSCHAAGLDIADVRPEIDFEYNAMDNRSNGNRFGIWRARRGSVAIQIGLMATAIIGMSALGTEIVYVLDKHRQMQSAADAAALSASTALSNGFPSDINVEARAVAADAGFVNGVAGTTVTLHHPPLSGANAGNNKAVEVTVAQPQTLHLVTLFRSGVFSVGARAVALVPDAWRYCMLALDPAAAGALTILNNGVMPNPNCGVAVNSSSNSALTLANNAAVDGPVSVVGNWSLSNNAHLNGTPLVNHAPAIADPYASMALQTIPACTGQPGSGGNGATLNLTPGHFCSGWNYSNNVTLNLAPGAYYIDTKLSVGNNAIVNGTGGVTLIVNGTYAISFANNVQVNITAPATGPYAGMAFFGTRNGSPAVTQTFSNNTTLNIEGVVYFPSQTIEFDNNGSTGSGGCTQVIGRMLKVQNNVTLDNNCAGTGVQPLGTGTGYLTQ
jgi:hypothetical protein